MYTPLYSTQIFLVCQENTSLFLLREAYTVRQRFRAALREGRLPPRKEGETMYSCDDPYADLDDLIFEKGDGGPSER